jgi:microcystin-dependent protein
MAEPFIGEIRLFAGNFAPRGYALCYGQLMSIAQFTALFALIGTTYGGDGQTTFALPDLRGRVPVHQGTGPGFTPRTMGERYGTETVTLTSNQIPLHSHTQQASTNAVNAGSGPSAVLGNSATTAFYGSGTPQVTMAAAAVDSAGSGQPHNNMAPFLALNFIIAVEGVFPARN